MELIEKIVESDPNDVKVNWKSLLRLISTLGTHSNKNFKDSMDIFFEISCFYTHLTHLTQPACLTDYPKIFCPDCLIWTAIQKGT